MTKYIFTWPIKSCTFAAQDNFGYYYLDCVIYFIKAPHKMLQWVMKTFQNIL